jgi:hypothetical protein
MLRVVLALTVLSLANGCATRGATQPEIEPVSAPQVVERVAYGVRGAALGALSGFVVAASVTNGDPKGTMYVSYATVPLFAFAGLQSGLMNGAASVNRLPSPLALLQAVGFRPRPVRHK